MKRGGCCCCCCYCSVSRKRWSAGGVKAAGVGGLAVLLLAAAVVVQVLGVYVLVVLVVEGNDGVGGVVVVFELRPVDVPRRAVGPGCAVRRGPLWRGGPSRRACCDGGVEAQVPCLGRVRGGYRPDR